MASDEMQLINEQFKTLRAEWRADISVIMRDITYIKDQTTRTNGRVTKLEAETGIGRWFERKPARFALIIMFFLAMYQDELREVIIKII